MSSFHQKVVRHAQRWENVTDIQEYMLAMETVFQGLRMLDLADSLHGSHYVKYVKRIKETTLKELKKNTNDSSIIMMNWCYHYNYH